MYKLSIIILYKLYFMRLEDEKFGDMSPYGVRMPRELKEKIKAAAKANRHSMNAEIIERLEESFRKDDYSSPSGTMHTIQVSKESYEAMGKFMEELRRSNIDLSTLKQGKPLNPQED